MKQLKRNPNMWKATNVTFDSSAMSAYSYDWWKFVAVVEGVLIFNDFRYSVTTAKHQRKVAAVMHILGKRPNVHLRLPRGLQVYSTLAEIYLAAEEHECDEFLENECAFRDYEIRPADKFGAPLTGPTEVAVHQLVETRSLESDVQNALHTFNRDGFGKVVFYV